MEDYTILLEKVADFDRRVATIICQGFDDCSGLEAMYKVIYLWLLCTILLVWFMCHVCSNAKKLIKGRQRRAGDINIY